MNNFSTYWNHADAISQTLYFVLLAMSIASWTIFVLRYLNTKELKANAHKKLLQAIQPIKDDLKALPVSERKALTEQALLRQMGIEKSQAEKGVAVLGTIASIAPFVGLFGTVWGIFHALVAIGESGQSGLAQVATPVGEALIMTGFGLAVAIPAVLGYNICTRINRQLSAKMQEDAHQILLDVMLNKEHIFATEEKKVESTTESTATAGGKA